MRIGSLCTGYGGLDLAVEKVTGATTAWVSDTDPGASRILEHRYPGAPNLGDFTTTDWATVEPVDIITAGFPCQPVSQAGKRLADLDERWLWDDVQRAVRQLRPHLVVLENVRGLITARGGRLFGRVVGSLAHIGYDTRWVGIRASDVGAPHARWRIFIVAHPAGDPSVSAWGRPQQQRQGTPVGPTAEPRKSTGPAALLPSPRTSDTNGAGHHGDGGLDLRTAVAMLPTPRAGDGTKGGPNQRGSSGDLMMPSAVHAEWGQYADGIQRWETLTRPAPPPTETGPKGGPRLNPRFTEWMMGLPDGHVTDVPGITRNQALKACGNGVVPQQAEAALWWLIA